jgi:penicillin G amidase
MRWLRRIAAGVGIVLVVALVAVGVAGTVAVRRGFPVTSGQLTVPGLTGPVTVERDADGIPTIIATTVEDLFLAQGYVHAQDRFWEMDLRRHVTAGRLSELFGEAQLETDTFIRTLGWRRTAEAELALLEPETTRVLTAYATGVNAWMAGRSGSELSLEHALLPLTGARGYRPEPWGPTDSVAWLKAMAWDLRSNLEDELQRARLAAVDLGAGRSVADLYPDYDAQRFPPIIPDGGTVEDGVFVAAPQRASGATGTALPDPGTAEDSATVLAGAAATPSLDDGISAVLAAAADALDASPSLIGGGAESGIGSNSWVVAGSRSATGGALLANDPHLAPGQPGLWYQVRLRCAPVGPECPYDVAGYSFSGVPGIVIGRNDTVAWGFTNLGPDVADLVIERIDGDRYLTPEGWAPLEVRTEEVRVAGADPVTITIRATRNGPLFSDVSEGAGEIAAGPLADGAAGATGVEHAVALRWVALDPQGTANAIPRLMVARDWPTFREAARRFAVPSQNLVYADTSGNIGYQAPGTIPVRRSGDGTVPLAGWTGEFGWDRMLAFDELPWLYNPASGAIVTANQTVLPPGSEPFLHRDVSLGHRGARINVLLSDRRDLTLDDLAAIQNDNHNANAVVLVPILASMTSSDPAVAAMQAVMAGWDHQDHEDSAAGAAFNATWRALLARTFHDELPEWAWPSGGGRWWEVVLPLLDDPTDAWWDDVTTPEVETRDQQLTAALIDAHTELVERLGDDPAAWRWGDLHTLTLRHGTFGSSGIAPIERLFNRGPLPTSGGTDIVNSNSWNASQGFEVIWVPSMRMLVDLSRPDEGRWIHLTGQSGRPFHPHYVDQAQRWRTGAYAPFHFTPAATAAAATATLTLVPAG